MPRYPRKGSRVCRIHVSSTRERLGDLAKGLWRSAEFSASHTGWRSDLARDTASKSHFFAFLEAETPYPTPEYHDLARTGRGANLGSAGSCQEDHDWPIITCDNGKGVGLKYLITNPFLQTNHLQ